MISGKKACPTLGDILTVGCTDILTVTKHEGVGMNRAIRLSPCIEEYLASCASRGDADTTLRSKRGTLDKLLNDRSTGNILVANIGPHHIDSTFETMRQAGNRASTLNARRSHFMHFFKWCQSRRYIAVTANPMDGTRALKSVPRKRVMVPVGKFGHLLDCATHPRDRMVVALGLYLFVRQSEISSMRVDSVDLDGGWLDVQIHKTGQRDRMPVSSELDVELRRWLTFYAESSGSLDPSWALVPARGRPVMRAAKGTRGFAIRVDDGNRLQPTHALRQIERVVQAALVKAGFSIWDDEGRRNFEGVHTLRRSGARARFDALIEAGHDGAIREVQAMLHHSSTAMTEHYLGLTLDIDRRDKHVRGKPMFPGMDSSTIVTLPQRRAQ